MNYTRQQVQAAVIAAFVNNGSVLDVLQHTPGTTIDETEIDSLEKQMVLDEIETALSVTLNTDQKDKIDAEPTIAFITEVFYVLS